MASLLRKVGFIGLTDYGLRMALRLRAKHPSLLCYHPGPAPHSLPSSLQLVDLPQLKDCQQIVLCVQDITNLTSKPDALFEVVQKGSIFLDTVTREPKQAETIYKKAAGHVVVDCPYFGTLEQAERGQLHFMVGSPNNQVFDVVYQVLSAMGDKVHVCGGPGKGNILSLCNNLAMAVQMLAVSEAFTLGKANGIKESILSEVMKVSSGRCWALEKHCPVPGLDPQSPSSSEYKGGIPAGHVARLLQAAVKCEPELLQLGRMAERQFSRQKSDLDYGVVYKHSR